MYYFLFQIHTLFLSRYFKILSLPKVHFSLPDFSLQTFCSIRIQLQGSTPQFRQRKTHELIRLNYQTQLLT